MFKAGKDATPQASLLSFYAVKPSEIPKDREKPAPDPILNPPKRVRFEQVLIKSFDVNCKNIISISDDVFNTTVKQLADSKRTGATLKQKSKERAALEKETQLQVKQALKTRQTFSQPLDRRDVKKRQRKIELIHEEYAAEEEGRLHDLITPFYKIVLGTGSVSAQVMFIGSFPSWEETRDGDAFESKVHKRLISLLTKYDIDTTDQDCYYTHVVKIRPRDRWPMYKEIKQNLPFLLREIKTIRPKIIVCIDRIATALALRGFRLDRSLKGKRNRLLDDYAFLTEKNLNTIHDEGRNITAIRFDKFQLVCRLHILPDISRLSEKPSQQWEDEMQQLKDAMFLPRITFVDAHELLAKHHQSKGYATLDDLATRKGWNFSRPTDCFIERRNLHHRPLLNNYIVDHLPGNDSVRVCVNTVVFLEARNEFVLYCGTLENYSVTLHVTEPTFEFWIRHGSFEQYVDSNHRVDFRLLTKTEIEAELELKLVSRLHGVWPFEDCTNEEIWDKLGVSVEYEYKRSAFLYQLERNRVLHITYKNYSILKALKAVLSQFFVGCEFFETKVTPVEQLFYSKNIYSYGWISINPLKLFEVEDRETIDDLEFTCKASALKGRNPNTGQSRSSYDEALCPITFAATDFEMFKAPENGAGMPGPESDSIVRICVYLSHTNPQLFEAKLERLRNPHPEKPDDLIYFTGRTKYANAAAFVVGLHAELTPDVFKPVYLPYPPVPPKAKPAPWCEEVTVPYLRGIYDWNLFVERCVDWVQLIGTYRASKMFRNPKLDDLIFNTDLTSLPKNQKEWQKHLLLKPAYTEWRNKMRAIWTGWHLVLKKEEIENPEIQPPSTASPKEKGSIEHEWRDYHPDKWTYLFRTEAEMIAGFIQYTRQANVDVFSGHNVSAFDLTYLIKRIQVLNLRWSTFWPDQGSLLMSIGRGRFTPKSTGDQLHTDTVTMKTLETRANGARVFSVIRIPGRDIFDTLHYAQKGDAAPDLDGFTLSQLARKILNDNKHDVPWTSIPSLFFQKPEKLTDYCMQDTELCERILNVLNTMNYVIGTCRIIGCMTIGEFYTSGVQIKIIQLLMRRLKLSNLAKLMPDFNPFSLVDEHHDINYDEVNEEMYHKAMSAIDDDEPRFADSYQGARVLEVIPGFYRCPIPILDFSGLYPSIMDSENLGHNTVGFLSHFQRLGIDTDRLYTSGELNPNPFANNRMEPVYFLKRRCLTKEQAEQLPRFEDQEPGLAQCTQNPEDPTKWTPNLDLSDLVAVNRILGRARSIVKKEQELYPSSHPRYKVLDSQQKATKVLMNSTYGATGVASGRIACSPLGKTVTENGRRKIDWMKTDIEKHFGGLVIGGDTDSVFPVFEAEVKELSDVLKPVTGPVSVDAPDGPTVTLPFIMHVVNHVNARIPYPQKLNFEKAWTTTGLYQKKKADLAECMPFRDPVTGLLVFEDGGKPKISAKGTEGKRRSTAPYAKQILDKFVEFLWMDPKCDLKRAKAKAEKFIRKKVLAMRSGKYEYHQLILSRYYARTDYTSEEIPVLVINQKLISRGQAPYPLGSRVPMVVTISHPGAKFFEKVEDPTYAIEKKIPLDIEYYIDKHLRKPLERKCAVIDPSMMTRMFPVELKRTVYLSDTDALTPFVKKLRRCIRCNIQCGESKFCPKHQKKYDDDPATVLHKLKLAYMNTLVKLHDEQQTCYTCMGMDQAGEINCVNVHCETYPVRKTLEFDAASKDAVLAELNS
jgi:uracil-DNA glycosylase family 4